MSDSNAFSFADPIQVIATCLALSRSDRMRFGAEARREERQFTLCWDEVRRSRSLPLEWHAIATQALGRGRLGHSEVAFVRGRSLSYPIGRRELVDKILTELPCARHVARLHLDSNARSATAILSVAIPYENTGDADMDETRWHGRRARFFKTNAEKLPYLLRTLGATKMAEPIRVKYEPADTICGWMNCTPDRYLDRAVDDSRCLAHWLAMLEDRIPLCRPNDMVHGGTLAQDFLKLVGQGRESVQEFVICLCMLAIPNGSIFDQYSPRLSEHIRNVVREVRSTKPHTSLPPPELQRLHLSHEIDDHLAVSLEMSARYDDFAKPLMQVFADDESAVLAGMNHLTNALDSRYPSSGEWTQHRSEDPGYDATLDPWTPPML